MDSGGRQHLGVNAEFATGLYFGADVNLRGGYFAHKDDGQTGCDTCRCKRTNLIGHLRLDLRRDGNSVEDARDGCGNGLLAEANCR